MSATSMGSDMLPTAEGSNARTSRRKRRVAIAGALALVVIAGAVIVGVTTTGSKSGGLANNGNTAWWLVAKNTHSDGVCELPTPKPSGWLSGPWDTQAMCESEKG